MRKMGHGGKGMLSILLSIYFGVGLFQAYYLEKEWNEEATDEEIEEIHESGLGQLIDLLGEKGARMLLYIIYMLFWLPCWVYSTMDRQEME